MTIIPNTNTIKSMSIFNFLNQVDFNTDQNHHTENVVMIAKRFGSDQDIECAEYVLKWTIIFMFFNSIMIIYNIFGFSYIIHYI